MVTRGEVWWVDFGKPVGSAPGYRRPAVVVSSDGQLAVVPSADLRAIDDGLRLVLDV